MSKLGRLAMCAGVALVGAAVWQELRRPPEEREWHGRVAGIVPYEFRPPTFGRIREALWNPEGERVLTDTLFGVGWSVNVGRVARLARERAAARQQVAA